MSFPLQITFRDMASTPALEDAVRRGAETLDHLDARIERAAVVIDRPHQHHRHGQHVRVRVELAVHGGDIVADADHADDPAHEDAYLAIRDAFRTARRRLAEHVGRRVAAARRG